MIDFDKSEAGRIGTLINISKRDSAYYAVALAKYEGQDTFAAYFADLARQEVEYRAGMVAKLAKVKAAPKTPLYNGPCC